MSAAIEKVRGGDCKCRFPHCKAYIDRSLCTLSTSTIPAAPLRYFPQNLINLALCEIYYYLSLILSITIGSRNSQPGT